MLRRAVRGLTRLLRRRRSLTQVAAEASVLAGNSKLPAGEVAAEEMEIEERMELEADAESCDDEYSALDLAGLRAGTLCLDERRRLAAHLRRCETCRIVLAIIIEEEVPAEGTGKHAIPKEWRSALGSR